MRASEGKLSEERIGEDKKIPRNEIYMKGQMEKSLRGSIEG